MGVQSSGGGYRGYLAVSLAILNIMVMVYREWLIRTLRLPRGVALREYLCNTQVLGMILIREVLWVWFLTWF